MKWTLSSSHFLFLSPFTFPSVVFMSWCVHMFDCPSIYRLCQERFLSRSSPKSLLPAEESQKMYENSCYERQLRMKREKVGGGNATILVTRRSGNDHQSTCIMSSIFNLPFALAVSQGTQKNLK